MTARMLLRVKLRSRNPDGEDFSEWTCLIDNVKIRIGQEVTLANSEDPQRR